MKKKILVLALAAALVMGLTACTTVGQYTNQYFGHISQKTATWLGTSSSGSSTETADDGKTALSTPTDLSVTADGSFSFGGVDGADSYAIYMYDKATGDGRYASGSIPASGSILTGNLADYDTYGYGDYRVEVVAYPAMGDQEHKKSESASCELSVSGEVEEAQIGCRWDCFTKTLDVQLTNVEHYLASVFPSQVTVTFTNTSDSSDVVTLSFADISLEEDVFYASTTDVTLNADYAVTASVEFPSLATNGLQLLDLGTLTTAEDESAISDGFAYKITSVYNFADFPTAAEVDPTVGGSIGTWYYYSAYSMSDKGIETPASLTGDNIFFTAEPAETTEGSAYSLTVRMANADGKIVSTGGFGGASEMAPGVGTLELYPDGTFLLTITGSETAETPEETQAVGVDGSPLPEGYGGGGNSGVGSSAVNGTWKETSDGRVKLSYDLSTAVSTAPAGDSGFPF